MRPQKPLKLDLHSEYPCPCRRQGRLVPILLTEAFGCDRCQQIFAVEDNGQVIEQLSSSYPYKRTWRWTGVRWIPNHRGKPASYLPILMGVLLVLLVVWLPAALRSPASLGMIFWVGMASLLILLPLLASWLAHRR